MCGILGAAGQTGLSSATLKASLDSIAHRGPDGEGQWMDDQNRVWLGHRRLSILDTSAAGSQPMLDPKLRYVIVYNGEIYNYVEVREELKRLGHQFRSGSDTEVILEAYDRWGIECLQRLNGMFSLAIYDRENRRLFCARDRYGEKPFLFARIGRGIAFASEYKALLRLPGVDATCDESKLVQFAYNQGTGLDGHRQTVFAGVEQLLPGEALTFEVDAGQVKIWTYWRLEIPATPAVRTEAEAFAQFRDLLKDSVRIRMRSDVPVGSCLSGGLDSSAIVMLARDIIGPDAEYHTFTGVFPGTASDEWTFAEQIVDAARTKPHVAEPTVDGFLDDLPTFLWHNELPVGTASQYAQWCVFRTAKQNGVTVLLDGQGADETLGGYEQYFQQYIAALTETGQSDRLRAERSDIEARYPMALASPRATFQERLPLLLRHFLSNQFSMGTNMLYGVRTAYSAQIQADAKWTLDAGPGHTLSKTLKADTFNRFLSTLLRYGDRNSMAHSREVRLPFCDHRIAEFALSLPPEYLMGENQTKRLIRESMRGMLPEAIRARWNKQGFLPPQTMWFRSAKLRALAQDVFASRSFRESPFWLPKWWDRTLQRLIEGQDALAWVVWKPMMIELWKTHFLARCRDKTNSPVRLDQLIAS